MVHSLASTQSKFLLLKVRKPAASFLVFKREFGSYVHAETDVDESEVNASHINRYRGLGMVGDMPTVNICIQEIIGHIVNQ